MLHRAVHIVYQRYIDIWLVSILRIDDADSFCPRCRRCLDRRGLMGEREKKSLGSTRSSAACLGVEGTWRKLYQGPNRLRRRAQARWKHRAVFPAEL